MVELTSNPNIEAFSLIFNVFCQIAAGFMYYQALLANLHRWFPSLDFSFSFLLFNQYSAINSSKVRRRYLIYTLVYFQKGSVKISYIRLMIALLLILLAIELNVNRQGHWSSYFVYISQASIILIYQPSSTMLTYITEEGKPHMRSFQYKGMCDSITYKHLWSPLADRLLNFVPSSVAPNTITFTAFIFITIAHAIFVAGVGNQSAIANWRLALMGISIVVYQNLDNLDGKQARKTKSSSALGMLFDHGADAVISFFLSIQILQVMQIQSATLKIFTIALVVMMVYFCALWSQYSIGFFRLGKINPVDQGLPSYALFALLNILIPHEFWNSTHFFGKYNQTLLYGLFILAFPVAYFMVYENYHKAVIPIKEVNYALLLPATYLVAILGLYFSSKCPFEQAMWPLFYGLTFSWSRNMIEMQLYYVTKQRYNPFNLGTLGFVVPSLAYLFLNVHANTYFWGVAGLSVVIFLQFVISVVRQSARILNINVFSLKPKSE